MPALITVSAGAAFLILGFLILVLLREQICDFFMLNQHIAQQQQIISLLEEQNRILAWRQQSLPSLLELSAANKEEHEVTYHDS